MDVICAYCSVIVMFCNYAATMYLNRMLYFKTINNDKKNRSLSRKRARLLS